MSRPHPTMFVGEIYPTTNGPVEVLRYEGHHKVTVVFEDGTEITTRTGHIRDGNVKNPNKPCLFSVGYVGVGVHKPTVSGKITPAYELWRGCLRRCYDEKSLVIRPTYRGCTVQEKWHNFQNFAEWYYNLQYSGRGWELDKDLLSGGMKVYSESTCVMLPHNLNILTIKCKAKRGEHPIGVSFNKRQKKFGAYITCDGNKFLGYYDRAEDAFIAYKQAKETFIKQQANKWRSQIDPRAYEALMNYTVEITD